VIADKISKGTFSMSSHLQLTGRMRGALRSLVHAGLKISHPHEELEPIEHNGLIATCHRDWPDDYTYLARWNALASRDPMATVFNGPAWQRTIVDEFIPAGVFRLVTVERGRDLVAVLPLGLNSISLLETPGHWLSDYLEPLVDPDHAIESWEAILTLVDHHWDWSLSGIKLHHIRPNSSLRQILPPLAPMHRFEYQETPVAKNPFIRLPQTWDQYLQTLHPHERKELKRKLRNAETKANLKWLTLKSPEEIAPALERAVAAMRESEALKADFTDEVLGEFLRCVVPRLARAGEFYVQELELEGSPAAWLLCLPSTNGPMIYNTTYDATRHQWSPGVVAFAMSIQEAIAAGAQTYNLLRGDEEYKHRLGAQISELYTIELRPI
jgi:CelD/BcsL family acetyltransferase involved in cellulose biosynthesis